MTNQIHFLETEELIQHNPMLYEFVHRRNGTITLIRSENRRGFILHLSIPNASGERTIETTKEISDEFIAFHTRHSQTEPIVFILVAEVQNFLRSIVENNIREFSGRVITTSETIFGFYQSLEEINRIYTAGLEAFRHETARMIEKEREAKNEAEKRALEFLHDNLNDEQRHQFKQNDYFTIRSQFGHIYRINKYSQMNVEWISEHGQKQATLCVVTSKPVPLGDQLLMQKIMLETNERGFLKVANVMHGRRPIIEIEPTPYDREPMESQSPYNEWRFRNRFGYGSVPMSEWFTGIDTAGS